MTPEETARLEKYEAMEAARQQFLGQVAPQNQAVLEQAAAASDIPTIDPATGRPVVLPSTSQPNLYQGGQGADFSYSGVPSPATGQVTAEEFDEAWMSIPGMPAFTEFAQSLQLSTAAAIDFFGGPDFVNSILATAGSEKRVPTATGEYKDFMYGEGGERPNYMEPGSTGQQAVRTGGEYATIGAGLAKVIQAIPKLLANPQTLQGGRQVGNQVMRQMSETADVGRDLALGGVSGVGAEYGRTAGENMPFVGGPTAGAIGEVVGSIAAPLAGAGAVVPLIKNAIGSARNGFKPDVAALKKMSAELDIYSRADAERLISQQLVRENMTPEEAIAIVDKWGPDTMLADLGPSFRDLLRQSVNRFPVVAGNAGAATIKRTKEQSARVLRDYDDASGTSMLTSEGEMTRLNNEFGPKIKALYDEAREQAMGLSLAAQSMIKNSPTLSKISRKAEERMADRRATGHKQGTIDYVDHMKREIDDLVETELGKAAPKKGEVANLMRLKEPLVAEADLAIPRYKEARESFATAADLQHAVNVGQNIFKLSDSPADFKAIVNGMNPAQIQLVKLGVKDAILKKFHDSQLTSDTTKAVFGKEGSLLKMKYLWKDDEDAFKAFSDVVERESEYIITRNATTGNSSTVQQAVSMIGDGDARTKEILAAVKGDKSKVMDWAFSKIAKLWSDDPIERADPMETAGHLLYMDGWKPAEIRKILAKSPEEVQKEILKQVNKYNPQWSAPAVEIGASELITE